MIKDYKKGINKANFLKNLIKLKDINNLKGPKVLRNSQNLRNLKAVHLKYILIF